MAVRVCDRGIDSEAISSALRAVFGAGYPLSAFLPRERDRLEWLGRWQRGETVGPLCPRQMLQNEIDGFDPWGAR